MFSSKTSRALKMLSSAATVLYSSSVPTFETLAVTVPKPHVFHVELNRPDKLNAFSHKLWIELGECFLQLGEHPECRAIVLSAAGKHFTAGIDFRDMMRFGQDLSQIEDVARKAKYLTKNIKLYQDGVTSLENCVKPVIAAVHSACVGAGVDLITAADMRYCSKDAWFQVKEVDIGMAADVGTLQRLPKVIGNMSLVRELCYTGRKVQSDEAYNCGLVSRVFDDKEKLINGALEVANEIAQKSPVAVQTTKKTMNFSLNRTNQEGLDYVRLENSTMMLSEDFINAVTAQATKGDKPVFSKL